MSTTTRKSQQLASMDAGFLTPSIALYRTSLEALGHSELTVRGYTDAARHLAAWIIDSGLRLEEVREETVDRFGRHRCRCAGARRWNGVSKKYARRAGRFVRFLADRGLVAQATAIAPEAVPPTIIDYQRWSSWPVRALGLSTGSHDQALAAHAWRGSLDLHRRRDPRGGPSRSARVLSQSTHDGDERASRLPALPRGVRSVSPRVGSGRAAGPAVAALGSAALSADRGCRVHDRLVRSGHADGPERPGRVAAPRTAGPSRGRHPRHAPG